MSKIAFFSLSLLTALTAPCALSATSDSSPVQVAMQQTRTFDEWLGAFRQSARNQGIESWVLEQAFTGLTADLSIIRSDENQPEFSRPVWQYLESAISPWRIARGKALLAEHQRTLDSIETEFGVDRFTLVAIWGMESNFGQQTGDKSIVRSLATLAWHGGRRASFWENQLLAALRILQNGDITPVAMRGSWAGAMGQTQFMPTTYLQHAVDFDGNGKRDIWNSSADALASAANYLASSGWKTGHAWGHEAKLPTLFEFALADGEQRKPVAEWIRLGVQLRDVPEPDETLLLQEASLFLPAGYRGPAYLQLDNFHSILAYNNSTAYALAVGLLADSLAGKNFHLHRWPKDDAPLSRSERLEIQQLLNVLGLASGTADGIIGVNTRKAIRSFQLQHDLPADGHASARLLQRLREATQEQAKPQP